MLGFVWLFQESANSLVNKTFCNILILAHFADKKKKKKKAVRISSRMGLNIPNDIRQHVALEIVLRIRIKKPTRGLKIENKAIFAFVISYACTKSKW